jgi:LMBR1 domain-containing protein 1
MNWWLVVTAVLGGLLTVGVSAYIIFILTTPSELKVAIMPKLVALLGLSITFCAVLLLPYEVANAKDPTGVDQYGGGVDTVLMWQILFVIAGLLIVVFIPFAIFFYEAHDPEQFSFLQQCTPAFLYTLGLLVAFLIVFLGLFFSIGYAIIPYFSYTTAPQRFDPFDSRLVYSKFKTSEELKLRVSVFVYFVGCVCAIGWFFFIIYGGVGLVALPVGLMRFVYKSPKKPLTEIEFIAEQETIAAEALNLMREAKNLQRASTTDVRVQVRINRFNNEVESLANHLEKTTAAYEDKNFHYVKLLAAFLGSLLCTVLTVLWVLHIFLHNIVRLNGFLNVVLVELDKTFHLLGMLLYALLVFFLLWCVIVGNVKVGLRFTFFSVHPLKYRDTRINSILFNVGLLLTTSVAIVQFCTYSFVDYVAHTAADSLFDTYVSRLQYIGVMFKFLELALLAVFLLSSTWVILCPRPKPKEEKEEDD